MTSAEHPTTDRQSHQRRRQEQSSTVRRTGERTAEAPEGLLPKDGCIRCQYSLISLISLSTLERQGTDLSSTFLVVGGLAGSYARNEPPFRSFLPTPHANAPALPSVHIIPRSSSRPDAREDYRPRFELQERSEPAVCEPAGRRTGRGVFNGRVFLWWRNEQEEFG